MQKSGGYPLFGESHIGKCYYKAILAQVPAIIKKKNRRKQLLQEQGNVQEP